VTPAGDLKSLKGAGAGFTLIELLTVIAVIAVLAAILIPVASGVRVKALNSEDQANLRSISVALGTYSVDHRGCLPSSGGSVGDEVNYTIGAESRVQNGKVVTSGYVTDLLPYVSDHSAFISPLSPEGSEHMAYKLKLAPWAWSAFAQRQPLKMINFQHPSKQIIAHQRNEADPEGSNEEGYRLNVVFADGHIKKFYFYPTYNKESGTPDPHWFNDAPSSDRSAPIWHGNPNTSWDNESDPGYWNE